MTDLILRSRRVVTPEGIRPASLHVAAGRIQAVEAFETSSPDLPVIDAEHAVVLPGLVDTHVHVNEPGRTDWEGFATATRAAAAGGVTTLLDMPLNGIPATTSVAALTAKRAAARDQAAVDVGFIGGVVPGNTGQLSGLWAAGVHAFKCFLVPSGSKIRLGLGQDLRQAMPVLAGLDARLMIHAELPGPIVRAAGCLTGDPRRYATWQGSRPASAEAEAIRLIARLAAEFALRVHVVHLASADSLAGLSAARRAGVRISVETCPHYLTFAARNPRRGHRIQMRSADRVRANRDLLWKPWMRASSMRSYRIIRPVRPQ